MRYSRRDFGKLALTAIPAAREKHTYPAAIELEYDVPAGSDAVKETAKCLDYCKATLANA